MVIPTTLKREGLLFIACKQRRLSQLPLILIILLNLIISTILHQLIGGVVSACCLLCRQPAYRTLYTRMYVLLNITPIVTSEGGQE